MTIGENLSLREATSTRKRGSSTGFKEIFA